MCVTAAFPLANNSIMDLKIERCQAVDDPEAARKKALIARLPVKPSVNDAEYKVKLEVCLRHVGHNW